MISKWIIKALVQKSISFLPASQKINYFFQKNVTGGVILGDEHFGLKIGHARDHFNYFKDSGVRNKDLTVLELGTGWYPVIPILFYLTGLGRVISVDIQQWMNRKTQQDTILKYRDWKQRGLLKDLEPEIEPERWNLLMDVLDHPEDYDQAGVNHLIGLTPRVLDARHLDLEDGSVDFICSNNTFEHIHSTVLKEILAEFKRILHPHGMMSHFIDMSDHFAHFDKRISIYNFLKFSEQAWKLIDNNIQPQNRLRYRDYLDMYHRLGLPVSQEEIRKGSLEELSRVKVHSEFSDYSPDELAISHAYIITRPVHISPKTKTS